MKGPANWTHSAGNEGPWKGTAKERCGQVGVGQWFSTKDDFATLPGDIW